MRSFYGHTVTVATSAFIAACLLAMAPSTALAQAASTSGVATGGDKITAIVPEAGDIFTSIDEIESLHTQMIDCAKNGQFFDQDAKDCRQGVPPKVSFYEDSGTYVDVQRGYPNHETTSTYGNLDGDNGDYDTVPWSD